jgi:membrane protease YdiL (CAAX protease family)
MSLIVWLGWILFQRAKTPLSPVVFWVANFLAAILFGIAHLPALGGMVQLITIIIIRTVLLNAIGGVFYGWLFWRRHLEAGMVAHASTHIGFFILRTLLGAFS